MPKDALHKFGLQNPEIMLKSPHATHYAGRLANGQQVVLKVLTDEGVHHEGAGLRLLARYSGRHSVAVLAQDSRAVLMERVSGEMLIGRWQAGDIDTAEDIAIGLINALHQEHVSTVGLTGLEAHFAVALAWDKPEALEAQVLVRGLLAQANEVVALHGDVHPRNIMRRGDGWCLIDPVGLCGPKAFDYANMFLNPWDFADVHRDVGRIKQLADKVSAGCAACPKEVLGWAAANALWWAEARARRGLGAGYPMEVMQRCVGTTHPTLGRPRG